ncbi:MAG: DUF393 domain-containing protein [Planctomycetes bacterium]|nr:DUF393 domain-containing protein [Planctomycetota bacterium]
MTPTEGVVFYDGVCGLCNALVQFVLRRDAAGRFRFASLQSRFAQEALTRYGKDPRDLDTFYLLVDRGLPSERLVMKGRAAVQLLSALGGPWRLLGALGLLPAPLLDWGYDRVARVRYRVFGKYEACLLPLPQYKARFIET